MRCRQARATRIYRGELLANGRAFVAVEWNDYQGRRIVRELTPDASLTVRAHSPTGFGWGYAGSGPAQLALALLLDFTESIELAELFYQRFKEDVVGQLPSVAWVLPARAIAAWVRDEMRDRARDDMATFQQELGALLLSRVEREMAAVVTAAGAPNEDAPGERRS